MLPPVAPIGFVVHVGAFLVHLRDQLIEFLHAYCVFTLRACVYLVVQLMLERCLALRAFVVF